MDFEHVEITSRAAWRAWLAANFEQDESIWLVSYKKHVPDKYVTYDEIVEEALCFGWVDSHTRRVDEARSKLLLSPRRAGSPWSGLNKRRVAAMQAAGLMTPAGQAKIDAAIADGSWTLYDEIEQLVIPPDLAAALEANPAAAANFNAFSPSSLKGILWWIKSAKRAPTRQKRITETVRLAALNLRANFPESRGK